MNIVDIWSSVYKTLICYFFLIIVLKIMGKREVGKVSTFDIVVFFVISELFSLSLNETDRSIFTSIIPVTIIVLLQIATALISLKSIKVRNWVEGQPNYIIYKGKINQKEMKRLRYNVSDLLLQLRLKDVQSPEEVEYAILENNGELNVIKKDNNNMNFPEPLILDGKFNDNALKKYGKTQDYVLSKIKEKGYNSEKEIFIALDLIDTMYIEPIEFPNNSDKI